MGREKKSLVHCACCASAYLRMDRALHEPLLEIVFVRNLLPLDEIASGDAGEMQRSLRISMGSHSHSKL